MASVILLDPLTPCNVTPPEEEVESELNCAKGLPPKAPFGGKVLLINCTLSGRLMGEPSDIRPPEDR